VRRRPAAVRGTGGTNRSGPRAGGVGPQRARRECVSVWTSGIIVTGGEPMSKKDIEAAEQQWLNAFNGGDAAGVAQQYEEQARLMPPNVDILEGRGAIEAFCKEFVATGAQLAFRLLTVHESPEVCSAVGTYEMTIPVPGGEPQKDSGK